VLDPSSRQAKTLTVLNLKGGVGKTHSVWLLAGVCQERGKRLLAIDADTQGNLTRSLLPEGANPRPGLEALFDPAAEADASQLVRKTRFSHVDVLPASVALAPLDLSNQRSWEKADLHLSLIDAVSQLRSQYDYIVFDCPPRLSLVSFAALCASDFVVIPLEAADWGAQGIVHVTAAVQHVQERYNPDLRLLGYLVSRFKRARAFQSSYVAKLREHFGKLAFDVAIPDRAPYERSVTLGVPITLLAPASTEAGIARRFFAEINRRIRRSSAGSPLGRRQDLQAVGAAAA
jgi:chromosome partitioning protein